MRSDSPVTLAELLSARVPLTAEDAAAVVAQLCRATPAGRPTMDRLDAGHVSIDAEGRLHLASGVLPTVRDTGALLERLLDGVRQAKPGPLPRRLVFLAASAMGQLGMGGVSSLTAFGEALAPFAATDPAAALRELHARARAHAAGPALQEPVVPPAAPAAPRRAIAAAPMPAPAPTPAPDPDPEPAPPLTVIDDDPFASPGAEPDVPLAVLSVFDAPDVERVTMRRQRSGARLAAVAAAAIAAAGLGWFAAWHEQSGGPERVAEAAEIPAAPPADDAPVAGAQETAPTEADEPDHDGAETPARAAAGDEEPTPAPVVNTLPPQTPQRLVDPGVAEADAVFSPSYSANGSAVFFHARTDGGSALKRAERGERGELRIATIVDDGANNYHVQLSPDGGSVAFDSDREGVRGVYVARADGHDVRRVSGPGYAAVPSWSPDGSRLAFVRAEFDRRAVWNLWVLDLSTNVTTRLTNHRDGQVWGGAWFPDGRRIAYTHEDQLVIRELGSGKSTTYRTPVKGKLVRTPAVSPDGKWIVFQVQRDGAWLFDTAKGQMQRVLDDPTAEEFTWAPDGRRVAFHSRRSGGWGLWTMAAP
jgi:hypothetical protein